MTELTKTLAWMLKGTGLAYRLRDLKYGKQFRFADGSILNVYDTGSVNWQGQEPRYRYEIEALLDEARLSLRGSGLFGGELKRASPNHKRRSHANPKKRVGAD